jgi:Spy/CpxP family protein refolding chaperone
MMKSKTTVALSTAAIAAVALLFAAGPLVGTQQALAYRWHGGWGWHHGWGWHGGWGWHHGWGWHGG